MEKKENDQVEDDSDTETFYCGICMEFKPMCGCFRGQGCRHYFCFSCIMEHINYRVLGGDIPVRCPQYGCAIGELTYEAWSKHIDSDVCNAWLAAMSREKAAFGTLGEGRCSDCGSFFVGMPTKAMDSTTDVCMETMHGLMATHGWRRCPSCGIIIEKIGGCSIMTCRCGCDFCYSCGKMSVEKEEMLLCNKENRQIEKDAQGNQQQALRYGRKHDGRKSMIESELQTSMDTKREEKLKKRIQASDSASSSSKKP